MLHFQSCFIYFCIFQDSSQENIIQRDVHRTFPAHDYFQSVGGLGQDSLYRISKAYSVFDREVGYCQGLSFLAAALLLHVRTIAQNSICDCFCVH